MYALQKYTRNNPAKQVIEHLFISHPVNDSAARAVCDVKSDGKSAAMFLSLLTLFGIMIAKAVITG